MRTDLLYIRCPFRFIITVQGSQWCIDVPQSELNAYKWSSTYYIDKGHAAPAATLSPKWLWTRKRPLYKQFALVHLKTQVRVTDPEWLDLMQHVWHGKLNKMHITMLQQLVLTHEPMKGACPQTLLHHLGDALLVILNHVVQMMWSLMSTKACTYALRISLINYPAFDTIQGRQLMLDSREVCCDSENEDGWQNHQQIGPNLARPSKALPGLQGLLDLAEPCWKILFLASTWDPCKQHINLARLKISC